MSREAKSLRDDVLNMVFQHGTAGKGQQDRSLFQSQVIEAYTPLNWERAVLYANSRSLLEAVCRRTSAAYYRSKDKPGAQKPEWQKGSIDGNRYKKIDWVSVSRFGPEWWIKSIQFPRQGAIFPQSFDKVAAEFSEIYSLFTSWLLIDFSYKTLLNIWDLTNRFSPQFIKSCMDLVEDKSKRSIEYLLPIIDKEFAIMRQEILERNELTSQSKQLLETISSLVANRGEPIDWNKLDERLEVDSENAKAFDEVKLS